MRAVLKYLYTKASGCEIAVLLLFVLSGCSSDGNSDGVQAHNDSSSTPAERIKQVREFAEQREFESAPTLIDALSDESPEVRKAAIESVEYVIGTGVQVSAFDPPEKRRAAVERYRRLYALAQEIGVEHVVDTIPALLDQMEADSEEVRRRAYEDIKQLTGTGLRFRADASESERRQVVARYRKLWQGWNQPGSRELELRRDPDKMRAFKRERVEGIKRLREQVRE